MAESDYATGARLRTASMLDIETPTSITARVERIDSAWRALDGAMTRAAKEGAVSEDDAAAWKSLTADWRKFRDSMDSYLARLQGALGSIGATLDAWEKDLAAWYAWAASRDVRPPGPAPTFRTDGGVSTGVKVAAGAGVALAAVGLVAWAYHKS